ncbi:MAG: flagellar filament capping protein FliD [Planctomycetaceae bacterium]|nr:flagellar filament capping protein FliD [Planctomycetaceae bacterium]
MTGLQLNVGLISGINFVDLVNQLIQLDAVPMNRLAARNEVLAMERDALTNTMARFLTTSYMIRNLNRAQPYLRTDVTSSNDSLIRVVKSGSTNPVPGSYTFTPLQMASAQQTVARGVHSDTEALGRTGTITIGKGWSVENEVLLQDINGGEGFSKGSIRLIDGNGQRATIDLRKALTVNDVINAINDNHDVDVIAELDGDRIVLRDVSGGDPSKMAVQEVSGGNTAASLGLLGRTVDASGAMTGSAIWRLGENMSLSLLNDGNGVVFDSSLPDFSITCKDGTTVNVDFNRWTTANGVSSINRELTVGDLLKTINNAGNGKLNARISDDGKGLVIEDMTTGGGITSIVQSSTHPVLRSLGLVGDDKTFTVDLFTGLTENGNTAKMFVQDKSGNSTTIELTNTDIEAIRNTANSSGAHSTPGYAYSVIAAAINLKLEATDVNVRVMGNSANDGLYAVDNGGGTGDLVIADRGTDIAARLGLVNTQETQGVALLSGATPGAIRFTDQTGKQVDIALTRTELDAIQTADDLKTLFETKLAESDGVGIEVSLNSAGTGVVFRDTSGGTASQMMITDHVGSNVASRLGITTIKFDPTVETALGNLLDGAFPGQIEFTDRSGSTATITISQSDLDGITVLGGLAVMFNNKLEAAGLGITAVVNGANGNNGLIFRDTSGGTSHPMQITDTYGDIMQRLGLESKQTSVESVLADATPGEMRFTDQDGNSVDIEIFQGDLDSVTSLADLATLFNDKLNGTGVGISVVVNGAGSGLVFSDISGGTGSLTIEPVDETNLLDRLGINTSSVTGVIESATLVNHQYESAAIVNHVAESHAIEMQSLMQGKTNSIGTFQTRNLIGGMDTVLTSTLNGGFGLSQAKAGGAIEVQDRAGNKANLVFSQTELNSMQTLNDSVKIFNQKLADAGVNITVRINDQKTGLQVVDNTGSSSHNLIFRDVVTSTTIPGTPEVPAIPAVPAVDAVSADNGTGGTALLTFEGTHWMNNFTFGFTTDENEAGYDSAPAIQKFTFYIDEDALQGLTSVEQDELVQAAINAQIASVWSSIFSPSVYGSGEPPKVKLVAGLAEQALDDAVSDGETSIKTSITGAVMGVTYVPEVPAIPAVPDTVVPNSPNIASSFGLNVNSTNSQASGGSLSRQIISYQTPLSELNGGAGVNMLAGRIVVTDSLGATATVTFNSDVKTVGDMIDFINVRMGNVKVIAKINETGDGITFEEFAGGTRSFSIDDADSTSRFAASLGINKSVGQANKDADGRMRITASETHHIEVEATDSLDDIRKKINDLNVGYSASILVDGSSAPFRLSISSKQTGASGAFNVDLSAIGLTTETMSHAKDAMITYGDVSQSTGLILRSSNNTFKGVIQGMDLTITGVSDTPVTITSASSNIDVKVSLESFVNRYNEFREELNVDMYFQVSANTGVSGHILWNNPVARALDRDITKMLQQTVEGIPGIRSLADLGITMRKNLDDTGVNKETGKLIFDEDKFQEAWARDPEAVQKFFFDEREYTDKDGKTTTVSVGWAQKFTDLADSFQGDGAILGKIPARLDTLTTQIDRNDLRIEFMEQRLEFKRQMYLKQFYAMEQAMARMTGDMSAVSNIANAWQSNWGGA